LVDVFGLGELVSVRVFVNLMGVLTVVLTAVLVGVLTVVSTAVLTGVLTGVSVEAPTLTSVYDFFLYFFSFFFSDLSGLRDVIFIIEFSLPQLEIFTLTVTDIREHSNAGVSGSFKKQRQVRDQFLQ
jgi:hypothetical protein